MFKLRFYISIVHWCGFIVVM